MSTNIARAELRAFHTPFRPSGERTRPMTKDSSLNNKCQGSGPVNARFSQGELAVVNELYSHLRLYLKLLPAPDEAGAKDSSGSQGHQALRLCQDPQSGPGLTIHPPGRKGRTHPDLPWAQPGLAVPSRRDRRPRYPLAVAGVLLVGRSTHTALYRLAE